MPTILLVEDERSLSSVLGFELKKSNFDVEFAYDGEEALEKLEKIKPDLILLDLILPKINGFDVLEKIKQNFDTRSIPVIVLSNLGSDDDIKRAIKLGASDYYVKAQHPLLEIVEKISKFLETRLKLSLHTDKVFIKTLASGVDFLGWIHFPHHRILRTSTKRRMFKNLDQNRTRESLISYQGLLSHGNTYNLSKKLLTKPS